jgi:exodeoxyribonuclease VII small subunit
MPEPTAGSDVPSFEDALAELERVVEELEGGELSLDDSLARYETGVRRLAECRKLLDAAERKVEILRRSADGSLAASPFPPPGPGGGAGQPGNRGEGA